nr:MAG TPA: hypothetical protein [Caudoviricetes sp.]
MVANYEAHGIKITASTLPKACTASVLAGRG